MLKMQNNSKSSLLRKKYYEGQSKIYYEDQSNISESCQISLKYVYATYCVIRYDQRAVLCTNFKKKMNAVI